MDSFVEEMSLTRQSRRQWPRETIRIAVLGDNVNIYDESVLGKIEVVELGWGLDGSVKVSSAYGTATTSAICRMSPSSYILFFKVFNHYDDNICPVSAKALASVSLSLRHLLSLRLLIQTAFAIQTDEWVWSLGY
jgi:hypothetical protein